MKQFDDIVVGSGISGLTTALLLAKSGRKVLLLERAAVVGGSMARYSRQGAAFDIGFHFTGGFGEDQSMHQMLKTLGIEADVTPIFLNEPEQNMLTFENDQKRYSFPTGLKELEQQFADWFPTEVSGLRTYFEQVKKFGEEAVVLTTASGTAIESSDEDFVSFIDHVSEYIHSDRLKALLCYYTFCYGISPTDISFANHCRTCYSLYAATTRVVGGGDVFVAALMRELDRYGVTVRSKCGLKQCRKIEQKRASEFILDSGEVVTADRCIYTIHPHKILDTLEGVKVTPAFSKRVRSFKPSLGFFTIFATVDESVIPKDQIIQIFSDNDVAKIFSKEQAVDRPIVLTTLGEEGRHTMTIFEVSFPADVEKWVDSSLRNRPADYYEYKAVRTENILQRIYKSFPEFEGKITVIDTASLLTYRDYLNSPFGCAYGIAQHIGQFNLYGRLPIKNLFATGQSAILPGVLGSMYSSFSLVSSLVDPSVFEKIGQNGESVE